MVAQGADLSGDGKSGWEECSSLESHGTRLSKIEFSGNCHSRNKLYPQDFSLWGDWSRYFKSVAIYIGKVGC